MPRTKDFLFSSCLSSLAFTIVPNLQVGANFFPQLSTRSSVLWRLVNPCGAKEKMRTEHPQVVATCCCCCCLCCVCVSSIVVANSAPLNLSNKSQCKSILFVYRLIDDQDDEWAIKTGIKSRLEKICLSSGCYLASRSLSLSLTHIRFYVQLLIQPNFSLSLSLTYYTAAYN